jgi:hypothetical protein
MLDGYTVGTLRLVIDTWIIRDYRKNVEMKMWTLETKYSRFLYSGSSRFAVPLSFRAFSILEGNVIWPLITGSGALIDHRASFYCPPKSCRPSKWFSWGDFNWIRRADGRGSLGPSVHEIIPLCSVPAILLVYSPRWKKELHDDPICNFIAGSERVYSRSPWIETDVVFFLLAFTVPS